MTGESVTDPADDGSGTCGQCGRNVLLTNAGLLWRHRTGTLHDDPTCIGSGSRPPRTSMPPPPGLLGCNP